MAIAHSTVASETKRLNDIFDSEAQSLKIIAQLGETKTQMMIMNQDTSTLDDDAKEYFMLKKKAILASLRNSSSSS